MKQYYKIYYEYTEGGKKILCRVFYGTRPNRCKEYKNCELNFNEGFIHAYGFDKCTPEEVHTIKINKELQKNNIDLINLNFEL